MKYTFTTDDQEEAYHAMHGLDYRIFIFDLKQQIRSHLKYGDKLDIDKLYEEIGEFEEQHPLS